MEINENIIFIISNYGIAGIALYLFYLIINHKLTDILLKLERIASILEDIKEELKKR